MNKAGNLKQQVVLERPKKKKKEELWREMGNWEENLSLNLPNIQQILLCWNKDFLNRLKVIKDQLRFSWFSFNKLKLSLGMDSIDWDYLKINK